MELEHPAVPGVGLDDEFAVGESAVEVDGVFGATILSLSPFSTSTGWWMLASWAFTDQRHDEHLQTGAD
jgi:hypothetical protein